MKGLESFLHQLLSTALQLLGMLGILLIASLPLILNDWFLRKRSVKREKTLSEQQNLIQETLPNPRRVYVSINIQIFLIIVTSLSLVILKNCVNEGGRLSESASYTDKTIRSGQSASGKVIEKTSTRLERNSRTSYLHYLTVEFNTSDNKVIHGTRMIRAFASGVRASKVEIGDRVAVRYLPEKPEDFVLPEFISLTDAQPIVGPTLILIFVCGLLLAFGMGVVFFRKAWLRAKNWNIVEGKIINEKTYEYSLDGKVYQGEAPPQSLKRARERLILLINPKNPTESVIHTVSNPIQIKGL